MTENNEFVKDPQAELDWLWDWSGWLQDDETITEFEVFCTDTALRVMGWHKDGAKITAWLSGGELNQKHRVVCRITTSMGRKDDRSVWIKISER